MDISRTISAPRLGVLVLAVLGGCGGNVNVVRQQKLELQPVNLPLRTFNYPSGLRVVVEKDTRTPLAGVFVVVGSGSSSDPKGKEGLAHYVEHLAFESRPFGQQSFADMLDAAGAITRNALTDSDTTTYYEIGPASALPQLLRIEAVRMVVPLSDVPDGAREIELDVVRNELRERNETGFVGDVFSRLQMALFPPGHPNASPVGGTHESLSSLTKADAEAFARQHYQPANVTLVVLGNVDLDKAGDLLADTLPEALVEAPRPVKLPERLAAVAPPVPEPPPRPAHLPKVEAAIAAPELWIGWSMPRGFDRDSYLLTFLASSAEERFSRLRLDDKDITGIDVFPIPGKDASMLLCRVALNEARNPEGTLQGVLEEAPRVVNAFMRAPNDESISTDILQSQYTFADVAYSRTRRGILVAEILGMQDLVQRGLRRALVTHFAEDPLLLSRALRDLADLKPERFRDYARPYLNAERARAVLFVPNGDSSRLATSSVRPVPAERERKTERLPPPPKEWLNELLTNPGQLTSRRLENGVSVVLVRRTGLPLVTASVSLAIGPAAAKEAAASALVRAMAFPATRVNEPSEYGANVSSYETTDSIVHTVQGASGNGEAIVATLAEEVRTMHLEPGSEMHFKDSVLPAYQREERDPHLRAERAFLSSVLPQSPYGHLPEYRDLADPSASAAKDWLDRTYAPGNATVVVVGDFDTKQMQGFVEDSFGGWKGGAPAVSKPVRPEANDSTVRTMTSPRPGATQGEVRFGCQLAEVSTGRVVVRHDLAAAVAGDRVERVLRNTLGASYVAQARAIELADGSAYFELQTNVENGKLPVALRELRHLLDDMAATPIDDRTLQWARYSKASSVALSQMRNDRVAASILRRTLHGLSSDLAELGRDLYAVSAKDVQEDFQRCLAGHPTLSIVGEEALVQAAMKEGWR